MLLGNPGILGQGYACVLLHSHPGMYLGGSSVTREPRDTWTGGMPACVLLYSHPGMYIGGSCVTRESWDTWTGGMPVYYSIAIPSTSQDGLSCVVYFSTLYMYHL